MQQPDYSTNPFGNPITPPIEYLRIGFGKRLVAYLIDALILVTITLGLGLLLMKFDAPIVGVVQEQIDQVMEVNKMIGVQRNLLSFVEGLLGGIMTAALVVGILYPLIEGITGASPGKRILRIVVANQNGAKGIVQLFLKRYAIKNLDSLLKLVALLPALGFVHTIGTVIGFVLFFGCFAVLGASHLALHDMIAKTAIFHVEDVH